MNLKTKHQNTWKRLEQLAKKNKVQSNINRLQPNKLPILKTSDLEFDFSRQPLDLDILKELYPLAEESDFYAHRADFFGGKPVNITENRPALHMALRHGTNNNLSWQGDKINTVVNKVLTQMSDIVNRLHSGQWRGANGTPIRNVIHLGIGGNDLGPRLVCKALEGFQHGHILPQFVSTLDSTALTRALCGLDSNETLFIVVSKSFSTIETINNAIASRSWLIERGIPPEQIDKHFIAVTAYPDKAAEFGIPEQNCLCLWDWVGGRFSLWSAVGLCIALQIGMDGFYKMLDGARQIDDSFREANIADNIPMNLALIDIWNFNFMGKHSLVILPYSERLSLLPSYAQQLHMESNGKQVTKEGKQTTYNTSPVVWGGVGSDSQHSFHQHLHQGRERFAIDFILPLASNGNNSKHHDLLVSFCLAQGMVFQNGDSGLSTNEINSQDHGLHTKTWGNQSSTLILMSSLNPFSLGQLMAIYEHKVYCQGIIWNINSFDQFGVEIGKFIGKEIYHKISTNQDDYPDPITNRLISLYKKFRNIKS